MVKNRRVTSFNQLTVEQQVESLMPLAKDIVEEFEFGDFAIESINHEFNSTFKISSPDGRTFALRINVNSKRSLANLRAEIFWVRELSKVEGLTVASPVANARGEFILSRHHELLGRDLLAVMFDWLDGEELAESHDLTGVALTGESIARMHLASRETQLPTGAELATLTDFFWGAPNSIETAIELPEPVRATLLAAVEHIQAVTDRLYARHKPQLIHADVHSWNVMWNGRDVAIFDFDDCGIGLPIQDLAVALYYLDTQEQRDALLDGYRRVTELPDYSADELRALLLQRRIFLLNYLLETENPDHRAMVPKYLDETLNRVAKSKFD